VTPGESLTARLSPVTLVVGKGGVGKTTVAAAIAKRFAREGTRTLVVTTDPAGTLLSAFGKPVSPTTRPVALDDGAARGPLDVWAVDTQKVRDDFLAMWRDPITQILDRGTYLDLDDVRGLVDATLPGADEIFTLLAIGEILGTKSQDAYTRVIIDTAPTGHTLRLLNLPHSFAAIVRLLDAMQEKHRFMVRALTHRYRADAADALITELQRRVDTLQQTLTDPVKTSAVVVTRSESVVIAESVRYLDALAESHIVVAAILINTWRSSAEERVDIAPLVDRVSSIPLYTARRAPSDTVDRLLESVDVLDTRAKSTRPPPASLRSARASASSASERSFHPVSNLARPLTIVAGKGGVGKTTVACAIAISAADSGRQTLIVSTDPAPSVGDALDQAIGHDETPVAGVPNLTARQMDATRAFAEMRDQYQGRIDDVFANITGRGVDFAQDREILRDLLSLAPPGIDELYALTILGNAIDEGPFSHIVVDPAPTGHLLRLLDMPALAIAWAHQLMRLMLKYKEVVGLGDAARDLLTFAKRTRALEVRLHDAQQATAVLVTLDEPLVRGETERLLGALRDRHLPVGAIIWNRADIRAAPLPTGDPVPQLLAPLTAPAPIGVNALRQWWKTVDVT
jgi:arsenite/tail-anchored protein-transporting ATPase